jgi:hypothetical protein
MNTLPRKVINRVLRNVSDIPYIYNISQLSYQTALEKHKYHLPIVSKNDLNLIERIKNEGVVITTLEALSIPSTQEMLRAARNLIPKIPKLDTKRKNEYVVHASPQQLMRHSAIFFWGLQERLLSIVENYLGLPVAYHGSYFRRDIANNVQRKTRLWHKDVEDPNFIKMIIYLHDVDEDGGAFQYIPKKLSRDVCRTLKYKYGHISDNVMQKVGDSSIWKTCTGSAGTVIIANTGDILHRGKIPVTSDRYTIFFDYTSRQPKFPFYCQSCLPKENLLLLAENLPERQRKCVLWQD